MKQNIPVMSVPSPAPITTESNDHSESFLWSLTIILSVAVCAFLVPLLLAFESNHLLIPIEADLLVSLLFLIDSKKNRQSAPSGDETKLSKQKKAVTIFSKVPIIAMTAALPLPPGLRSLFLLNHALNLPSLIRAFLKQTKRNPKFKKLKFALIVLGAMFVVHTAACVFVGIWPNQTGDLGTRYITALYFCVTTLTTVGYGDITAPTNFTRMFAMMLMLLGAAGYSLLISQMSNFLISRDTRKEAEEKQMESLTSLFRHYEIPRPLQNQALSYFSHASKRQVNDDEHKLLDTFPKGLRAEIQVFMNIKPLSHVMLFKGCSTECLVDAAHRLEQFSVGPGESIVHEGESGDEMYVLGWGRVLVHIGDKHITELKDGSCFGEMALIREEKRAASILAMTHCDLFKLERTEFQVLIERHADLRRNVDNLVASRDKKSA